MLLWTFLKFFLVFSTDKNSSFCYKVFWLFYKQSFFFPVGKSWYSLPVGTRCPGVKASPCIVNLNDKQVYFKHLLFKISGLLGQSNRRVLIERELFGKLLTYFCYTNTPGTKLFFFPPTSPSSVEFLHHCNINYDTLSVLSFLTERPFSVISLLSSHSNS